MAKFYCSFTAGKACYTYKVINTLEWTAWCTVTLDLLMIYLSRTPLDVLLIVKYYWASEASPTLGCSIEISRDIYMYIYVGMSVVCQINCVSGITWMLSHFWAEKTDL